MNAKIVPVSGGYLPLFHGFALRLALARKDYDMITWSRVDELADEIGADDFAEVVALFLDEVEGELDRDSHATFASRV